jgi:hypothetical protein
MNIKVAAGLVARCPRDFHFPEVDSRGFDQDEAQPKNTNFKEPI